jgi:ATP-dependent protease ClpP protease subunit
MISGEHHMATDRSKLDEVVNTGIDWDNRKIFWGLLERAEPMEEFSWATVEHMVRAMHKMYDIGKSPIELHFNSPGGNAYDMLRLIDEIEAAPCQIKFVGSGLIASCATWVMAVCDHRTLHKNTVVLLHDGHEGFSGSHTDAQLEAQHSKKLQDRLYDMFVANSRMPKAFFEDLCQRDLYLSAEETLTIGLCDEIIPAKRRGNVRKLRQKILADHPEASELQKLTKELYNRIGRRRPSKLEIAVKQEEADESLIEIYDKPAEG